MNIGWTIIISLGRLTFFSLEYSFNFVVFLYLSFILCGCANKEFSVTPYMLLLCSNTNCFMAQ